PCARSSAMAGAEGPGPGSTGLTGGVAPGLQLEPSHSQTSDDVYWLPWNITTRPRAASNAIACPARALGLVTGVICVQSLPFHSQVSWKPPPTMKEPPPNSTTRLRGASYAIA